MEELTPKTQQETARILVENTGRNVFLTGRAGTGKTTFLHEIRKRGVKRMVVAAPTGVAAINAGGITLHSFFQLPFGLFLPGYKRMKKTNLSGWKLDVIRNLDLLVIDEVSMLRADTLDEIDRILQARRHDRRPFGGVQLLMIGDLQQLAPIVKDEEWEEMKNFYPSPYFFHSRALQQAGFTTVELTHIYRQADPVFIGLLEKIRNGCMDRSTLQLLSSRYIPGFMSPEEDGYITLTTHNAQSDNINQKNLEKLKGPLCTYKAEIEGDFPENLYPVQEEICLKPGAQVMFVKNDSSGYKLYYNGKIGEVAECSEEKITVESDGVKIEVGKEVWENIRYRIDGESKQIKEETEGRFTQFPLKLAWAITIHKSQGLTFDKVVIDAGRAFAHGQVYVALSRCRSLEGLVLRSPLTQEALIPDMLIDAFCRDPRYRISSDDVARLRSDYEVRMMGELYDFSALNALLGDSAAFAGEHFSELYSRLQQDVGAAAQRFHTEVFDVGERFRQTLPVLNRDIEGSYRNGRCYKAAVYFSDKLDEHVRPLLPRLGVEIDNRKISMQWDKLRKKLAELLDEKRDTLLSVINRCGFDVTDFLKARSLRLTSPEEEDGDTPPAHKPARKPTRPDTPEKTEITEEQLSEAAGSVLAQALIAWRRNKSKEEDRPAFHILTQKTLYAVAASRPRTIEDLRAVKGIGKVKAENYGREIVEIVLKFWF